MSDFSRFNSSDTGAIESNVALTGEVIYESVRSLGDRRLLKAEIHQRLEQQILRLCHSRDQALPRLIWASYLVIFSPGQEMGEVRCQVDLETDGERAGFAVGYGPHPTLAFLESVERLQWYEKNQPLQVIV